MPAKGYKMTRAQKNAISRGIRKFHARKRRNEKKYGPQRSVDLAKRMFRIPNNKVVNVSASVPVDMEEQPMSTAEPPGYVAEDTYNEMIERYKLLQLELAERDVLIARLHLELSEVKRDTLKRINSL